MSEVRLLPYRIASTTGSLTEGNQIQFTDLNRTAYVSVNGDNANSGTALSRPVQTFQQAFSIVEALTGSEDKSILCLDASAYNENLMINTSNLIINARFSHANNIEFSSGNINNKIFLQSADAITIRPDNNIDIGIVEGNVTFVAGANTTTNIKIGELGALANLSFAGATGSIHVEIEKTTQSVQAILSTVSSNLRLVGYIGDTFFGGFNQERIPITSNTIITTANLDTYNKKLLYTPSTVVEQLTITITEGINLDYFDVFLVANHPLRIITQGSDRVNGETDIRFTNLEGGKIIKIDSTNYGLIYDNTDPDMIDDYIDNARLDGNNLILENSNSVIPDLSVDLSSLGGGSLLASVTNHSGTGSINIGSDLANIYHNLQSTITGFDLLIDTTITDNSFFVIYKQGTSTVEFDISATPYTFSNTNLDPNAYNILGGSAVLFYTKTNVIYAISDLSNDVEVSDHPVIVTRDTPSLSTLAQLANASTDNNSALWIVANDQIASTESGVDGTIMVRSLRSGLLDANGDEISMTATAKNSIVLAGGTTVRIYSSTDLRVISAPLMSAGVRYPDISAVSDPLDLTGSQTVYNTYANKTLVITDSTTISGGDFQVYLPSLQNSVDLAYLNRNDVFGFRNEHSTDTVTVRTFQVGTSFSNGGNQIVLQSGQSLYTSPAPSGTVWQVLEFGLSTDITNETISINTDWYRDEVDATAADNSVRLHIREELVDGNVRDHISNSPSTNNPVSLIFQRKNNQDAIAWIGWWASINSNVPALGTHVEEIKANINTSLNYINNTISSSYDFELADPSTIISIDYVTHQTGDTVKVGLASALPAHIVTLDVITIKNNSVSANNGDWAITQIYSDRLAIDITIPPSSSANNTGASGFIDRTLYCRTVVKSEDFRQHNFNIYRNSPRNNPVTSFLPEWFDITTEPTPSNSILNIGYNTDIQATESLIAIQDDSENFFTVLGGPRGNVHYFDNTGGEYQNTRYFPINYEDVHVRTDGTCNFYLNLRPIDLPIGERRRYSIYSDIDNDDDDVNIRIGRVGATINSDEGLGAFGIRNGVKQEIELYNDGNRSGWRLTSPFSRRMPSTATTTVVTPTAGSLTMSIAEIIAAQNEDPNFRFMTLTNNKFVLKGVFDYDVEYTIKLRFDGNEDTGLSFVNCELVPTLTRSGTTTDITQATGNVASSLFFIRNGNNLNDNTKPVITLNARVRHQAQVNDEIGFELRFGAFPSGYSLSNLRLIHRQYAIQVTGGIE